MAVDDGAAQRRRTAHMRRLHLGTGGEEHGDDPVVAHAGRLEQRRERNLPTPAFWAD